MVTYSVSRGQEKERKNEFVSVCLLVFYVLLLMFFFVFNTTALSNRRSWIKNCMSQVLGALRINTKRGSGKQRHILIITLYILKEAEKLNKQLLRIRKSLDLQLQNK